MYDYSEPIFSKQDSVKELTYGSTIILTVSHNQKSSLFVDGFLHPNLCIVNLNENMESDHIRGKFPEFSFALFKILPFSSFESFKWQEKILKEFLLDEKKDQSLTEKKNSKERKKDFEDLLQSFDLEFNSNLLLYEKMKNVSIFFESSVFQLMHCETLKFLSLNNENPNDIKFELVDYPNVKSFFKFLPCLWIQKNRNNKVYENDFVYLCSTYQVCLRNPYLSTVSVSKTLENNNDKGEPKLKVVGTLEHPQQWKVFLYDSNLEEKGQALNKSKIGDTVWFCLSEEQVCLSAYLNEDPLLSYLKSINRKVQDFRKERTMFPKETMILKKETSERPNSKLISIERENFHNVELKFIKMSFLEKMASYQKNSMHSLWKIEAEDNFHSDFIKWNVPYRLRHFVSGKYLRLKDENIFDSENKGKLNKPMALELSKLVDENCYFYFIPVESIFKEDENEKSLFVMKDSYFKLRNCKSENELWIGIEKQDQESSLENSDVVLSPLSSLIINIYE